MLIYPEIIPTPDSPTIKFNQPRDQIDLDKELPRILHAQGWGCGTYFNVQFLNHEKTKLLVCGRFVVSEETETIQTNDANPYQPMTRTVFSRRAVRIGDWWPPKIYSKFNVDDEKSLISVEAVGSPAEPAGPRAADPTGIEVAKKPKRKYVQKNPIAKEIAEA